ncbi:anthranilate phosphoribosyltransferase, chloroplastic-like [Humulus lupulus]|uniref:anthranilate phosphoribosyltransferase, chloroplastic-like n=1 Tax=Humulus lupulus TaxID=3486 RepID=UPI002B417545|nr:anthranilate phosphoribosyltransferase, chloroplastic-like [Humulus lupulus]
MAKLEGFQGLPIPSLPGIPNGQHKRNNLWGFIFFPNFLFNQNRQRKLMGFNRLLNGADEALISAFLLLLRAKGETFEEIMGLARAMIKHSLEVEGLLDAVGIVGTGGDGANTVNISTGASILAAACGAKIAKQGNRSSSSACGSVDVLEELGIVIDLELEVGAVNFCFR